MPRTDGLSLILEDDIAAQQHLGWDSGATFSHGTFLVDPVDGLWKGWYISTPMGAAAPAGPAHAPAGAQAPCWRDESTLKSGS